MLLDEQVKQFKALQAWFQTPLGSAVAARFTRTLEPVSQYLRGDILLQLGGCEDHSWFDLLNYKNKWIATPDDSTTSNMHCALNHLPLPRNSVDCILAPLALEPFGSSFSLLDEIDRVLKPMGYVVLLSFNPWSFWGAGIKSGFLSCYDHSKIKMRTPMHMNRIFVQRGYSQCALTHFCFIPPINNQNIINQLSFLDEVGKMIWPFPSGFYCYIAQKYEYIQPSLWAKSWMHIFSDEYKSPLQPVA